MYYDKKYFNKLAGIWELIGEDTTMFMYIVNLCFLYPYEVIHEGKCVTPKQLSNGFLYRLIRQSNDIEITLYKNADTRDVEEVVVKIN